MVMCYLDEDVKVAIAEQLVARSVTTRTTQDEGRKGTRDHAQLWFAAQRGWTFVTNNRRDFRELHGALAIMAGAVRPRRHSRACTGDGSGRGRARDCGTVCDTTIVDQFPL